MAYFHAKRVGSRGGPRRRIMRRVYAETIKEYRALQQEFPEHVTLNLPSIAGGRFKTKSRIEMWIDADQTEILDQIGSIELPQEYLELLDTMIRDQFWKNTRYYTESAASWLVDKIKRKLIILLKSGKWIDNPEILSLQKLHIRIEKIDLGHCWRLNFSSRQSPSELEKWSRDKYRADLEPPQEIPDLEIMYKVGSPEQRAEIEAQLEADGEGWKIVLWRERYPLDPT